MVVIPNRDLGADLRFVRRIPPSLAEQRVNQDARIRFCIMFTHCDFACMP